MINRIRSFGNNFSVGQKILTVILLEIISYSTVTLIALSQINSVGNEVKQIWNLYFPLFSATELSRQQIQEMRINLKEIIFIGDRVVYDKGAEAIYISKRSQFVSKSNQLHGHLLRAQEMIAIATAEDDANDSIVKKHSNKLLEQLFNVDESVKAYEDVAFALFGHVENGSFLIGMEIYGNVNSRETDLHVNLDNLMNNLGAMKRASVNYAVGVEQKAVYFTIVGSLLTVCMVIGVFFLVVQKNITKPFGVLTSTIDSFDILKSLIETKAEKDLMSRGDELGQVARSLNNLKHVVWDQSHDLQSAKEEAELANHAKSHFLAAASHDLRQPLHAIQLFIGALSEKISDEESLIILSNIDAVSVSTGRLLNSLLDISELEAGTVKPKFESFPLQEVFRRVCRSFSAEAQSKSITFINVATSINIYSDPVLLERILLNLVSNAIRYTTAGKVLIGCRKRGADICIEVWDTGVGIHPSESKKIFEDFYQINNPERDRGLGLGLGLGIVRRLCFCLNSSLNHQSNLGRGSCFSVIVPKCHTALAATYTDDVKTDEPLNLAGFKVLVIEDDPSVLQATCKLLESWNLITVSARNTEEALTLVSRCSTKIDFIIADLRLPGGSDGVDAIARIQLVLDEVIPSLILTGDTAIGPGVRLSELGHRVLKKPVRPAKLRSLMSYLLKQNLGLS